MQALLLWPQRILPDKVIARFWSYTDIRKTDECWPYRRYCRPDGYGQFTHDRVNYATHRFAYAVTYGPFEDRLSVLHKCDNPPCCNPCHLFLGLAFDNVHDAMSKGRRRREEAEDNPNALLDWAKIHEIRASRKSQRALAKEYNVSPSTIGRVIHHETWKDSSYNPVEEEKLRQEHNWQLVVKRSLE